MKNIKRKFSKLWAKFLISQLKNSGVKNESVLRVLIYYLSLEIQKNGGDSIEIEYKPTDDSDTTLIILGYLTNKK